MTSPLYRKKNQPTRRSCLTCGGGGGSNEWGNRKEGLSREGRGGVSETQSKIQFNNVDDSKGRTKKKGAVRERVVTHGDDRSSQSGLKSTIKSWKQESCDRQGRRKNLKKATSQKSH